MSILGFNSVTLTKLELKHLNLNNVNGITVVNTDAYSEQAAFVEIVVLQDSVIFNNTLKLTDKQF